MQHRELIEGSWGPHFPALKGSSLSPFWALRAMIANILKSSSCFCDTPCPARSRSLSRSTTQLPSPLTSTRSPRVSCEREEVLHPWLRIKSRISIYVFFGGATGHSVSSQSVHYCTCKAARRMPPHPSIDHFFTVARTYLCRLWVERPRNCIAADTRARKVGASCSLTAATVPLYPHRRLGEASVDDLDDGPGPPLLESFTHSDPQPAVGPLLPYTPSHYLVPGSTPTPHRTDSPF